MMRDARPPPPGSGSSAGGAGRSGRCPPTLVAVALLLVLTGALLKSDARQTLRLRAWVKTRPAGELANGTARGGGDGESYFLGDLLSGLGLLGDEEDVAGGDGKSAGGDGKSAGADALEEGADDAADSGAAAEEAGSTAAASAGDGASSDGGNAAAGGGKAAQLSPPPVVAEADIVDTGGEDAAEEEADEDDEDEEAQGGGSEAAPTVAPIAGKPAAAAAVPSTAARVPPAPAAGMGSQQPPTRPQGRRRRERGSAGGAGAAASGGGGGGGSEEPNMVVRAYRAQLRRLLALPPEQRRYLRVTPMSGWGNKIRALSSALKLALATDRICLVDARTMAPFYGPMFDLPFRPWFARHVPTLGGGKGKHGGAGGTGWPHIEMRSPVKRNRPAKCWAEKRSLSACVDMSAQVVSYASYYNMDGLIQDTPELRAGLEAKLGSPLPSHRAYDLASLPALLPRLSRRLARHVADTQAALRWGDYRLVVGLHMRVFVDYWRRRVSVSRIDSGWWECASKHVGRLQAERRVPPNATLVYVASDLPAAVRTAKEALAGVAVVASAPSVTRFVHTETKKNFAALATVMTDWWLLGEADLLVGTELSTFSPTAAMRRGIPLVLGSMKPRGRGRRGRRSPPPPKCDLKSSNDLGTDA